MPVPAPPCSCSAAPGGCLLPGGKCKGLSWLMLLLSPAMTGLEGKPRDLGTTGSKLSLVQPSRASRALLLLCYGLLLKGLKLQGFTDFGLILSCFGMKINSLPSPSPF